MGKNNINLNLRILTLFKNLWSLFKTMKNDYQSIKDFQFVYLLSKSLFHL